jgi:glycosyltransferase involved in cell wall biosynthesis
MKNILYITSSFNLDGGAELLLFELLRKIDRCQYNTFVVVPKFGELAERLESLGIDVRVLDIGLPSSRKVLTSPKNLSRMGFKFVPIAKKLSQLIRSEKIDIVHTNTSVVFPGFFAAKLNHIPHIWHVREMLISNKLARAILGTLICIGSTRVICISNAVYNYLLPVSGRLRRRMTVIHDGIDFENFRAQADTITEGQILNLLRETEYPSRLVVTVGRINPWKGQDIFIQSCREVIQHFDNVKCVIVGGAMSDYKKYEQELKQSVERLGMVDKLIFTGRQPRNVISAILKRGDLFVLPTSTSEGLGQVLLEASAWAKPLVATDVGGPRDIILDGENGYLVPPRNPVKMAEAILRVLIDPEKSIQMGQASYNHLVKNFGIDNYVNSIQKVYCEIL